MVIFSTFNYGSYSVVFAVFVAAFVHHEETWNPKLLIHTVKEVRLQRSTK